jgi:hypothetical protein
MSFYNKLYRAAKNKIKINFFISANTKARDIVKDTNRSKLVPRRSGIMNLDAGQLKLQKKQMILCEI